MAKSRLAKVSTEKLKQELNRRLKELPKLIAQRDALNQQIAELEALAGDEMPRKPAKTRAAKKRKPRAKRARNTVSLVDALASAMKDSKGMGIAEAAKAVQAAGYKSKAKDFTKLVGMTLSHDKRFERVGRGQYRVRS